MKKQDFDRNRKNRRDFQGGKRHDGGKPGDQHPEGKSRDGKPRDKNPHGGKKPFDGKKHFGDKKPGGGRQFHGNPRGPARERFKGTASLWGVHAVTEAWKNPARTIRTLYITEQALKEFKSVMGGTDGAKRPDPTIVERRQIDDILPPGAVHQGIAVDANPLDEVFVQDLVIRASKKSRAVIVVLDQVTDPHNVGAIMRSACAFGADGIIMQSRHAPEVNGVLAKAASGAAEHIAVAYETNLSRAINHLQEEGYVAVGMDERGEHDIAAYEFPARTVIVMGAEGRGLRPGLRENCNAVVRLPTQGAIGSLNVSNAAAVALYAFVSSGKA